MLGLRRPDPDYVNSDRSQANFRLALKLTLGVVIGLWLIHLLNFVSGYWLNPNLGLIPRLIEGLDGVLFAPLLHANFKHLIDNSAPLAVVGTLGIFVYPNSLSRALPIIYLGSGVLVWLLGRQNIHIGASGLIYGLTAFVFFSGLLKRDIRGITVSMLVWFLYAGLTWGVLPQPGPVSWESHLAGALIGTALAIRYQRWDVPPQRKYSWDEEE